QTTSATVNLLTLNNQRRTFHSTPYVPGFELTPGIFVPNLLNVYFPASTRSEALLRLPGFALRRRSLRNTTSLWLRLNSMRRLLRHREGAGLCLDAAHRDHHRLHAHRDRSGDDEVQLRDAHQAGSNPHEGN